MCNEMSHASQAALMKGHVGPGGIGTSSLRYFMIDFDNSSNE